MSSAQSLSLPATPERAVALIAGADEDRARLGSLITDLGFACNSFDSATAFEQFSDASRAVVITFRVASATSRIPDMPETLRGRRVIVFSDLDEERHIVETLYSGAHHFFTIDESALVMRARLGAALRRLYRVRAESLKVAPFVFDLARRRVSLNGKSLELSPREFDLAHYLFAHRGRVVTNAELLTSVWSLPQDIDTRRIDTAACRVRGKMYLDERTGWVLRRFRREGYGLYSDTRDAETSAPTGEERREVETD